MAGLGHGRWVYRLKGLRQMLDLSDRGTGTSRAVLSLGDGRLAESNWLDIPHEHELIQRDESSPKSLS